MNPRILRLLPAMAAAVFTACSAGRPIIQSDQRATVGPTGVSLEIEQRGVVATYPVDDPAISADKIGVIGVLIAESFDTEREALRAATAEERAVGLREASQGLDVGAFMRDALNEQLGAMDWLSARPVRISMTYGQDDRDRRLRLETGNTHLFVAMEYHADIDMRAVTVALHASLVPRTEGTRNNVDDPPTPIYRNTIQHSVYLDTGAADWQAREAIWRRDDGSLLRAAIIRGVEGASRGLAEDLGATDPDPGAEHRIDFADPTGTAPPARYAVEVVRDGATSRVRWANGVVAIYVPAAGLPEFRAP